MLGIAGEAGYNGILTGVRKTVRITLDRPIRVRLTTTNKAKRLPPEPPNIKLDFRPPIRRNPVQPRIRNPQEATK